MARTRRYLFHSSRTQTIESYHFNDRDILERISMICKIRMIRMVCMIGMICMICTCTICMIYRICMIRLICMICRICAICMLQLMFPGGSCRMSTNVGRCFVRVGSVLAQISRATSDQSTSHQRRVGIYQASRSPNITTFLFEYEHVKCSFIYGQGGTSLLHSYIDGLQSGS